MDRCFVCLSLVGAVRSVVDAHMHDSYCSTMKKGFNSVISHAEYYAQTKGEARDGWECWEESEACPKRKHQVLLCSRTPPKLTHGVLGKIVALQLELAYSSWRIDSVVFGSGADAGSNHWLPHCRWASKR